MNVLLVDNEPPALRLLESILRDKPDITALRSFDNASDALACAESTVFDIAFTDIILGGVNGMDYAERLRSIQPGCKIVFCTGSPQYAIECINRGIADGYLLKPVDERQLAE